MKEISYEQALAELEDLVQKIEAGELPLAELKTAMQRAEVLKKYCEDTLRGVREEIEKGE